MTTPGGYYDRPAFNAGQIEIYSRQAEGWGRQLEEIGGQREQKQREMESMAAEIRWLQEQIPMLQTAVQEANGLEEIMTVREQADRFQSRLDELLAAYTAGKQELDDIGARYDQVLEGFNTAVSGYESEYAKYREGEDAWRQTVRDDREAIQRDMDAATAARPRLEAQQQEITDRIAALQGQGIEANQREIGQLQTRLYVTEDQLRQAQEQERLLQDELDYSTYLAMRRTGTRRTLRRRAGIRRDRRTRNIGPSTGTRSQDGAAGKSLQHGGRAERDADRDGQDGAEGDDRRRGRAV